ncbi:phage antirepressor N-terminal domain-containing protein [Acinetobacter ursingii]|uniref:phage antirepressor N-terminal domain-containing protein n=1 Tax=Acinetobacter ursingii TaxID=108980 RepID=UPI00124F80C1|nr:phage antirepressor N-terminal domain-containing protein [Acinetobacter ursingii]
MTSMSLQQITAPFHSAELYLVEHEGQPYTPMKPIVEGMGLDWKSQFVKLKQRFAQGMVEITIPTKGGLQTMLCLLLRKLPAWLYSIQSGKVKPELRDTVIMYQNECDDVLWDYWTKGKAVNPRTTKQERVPLKDAVNLLVAKSKFLNYPDAYGLIHQRFNVNHIEDIPYDAIPVAVEYVHHLIGEYIPKVERIDPDLRALELLASETTSKVMDYYEALHHEIKRLGGKLPERPAFNEEAMVRACVTRMVQGSRMVLHVNYDNKPTISLIPSDSWILNSENIAGIIGDPSGPKKELLPEIIKAAASRLGK